MTPAPDGKSSGTRFFSLCGSIPTAATPVPVALRTNVHMNGIGVTICADTATSRHVADKLCELPLAHTVDLDVGCRTIHVQRIAGAPRAPVLRRTAVTRCHNHPTSEMALDLIELANQRGLKAVHVDAVGLCHETVGGKPCETRCHGRDTVASGHIARTPVIIDAGSTLDLEQLTLTNPGKILPTHPDSRSGRCACARIDGRGATGRSKGNRTGRRGG